MFSQTPAPWNCWNETPVEQVRLGERACHGFHGDLLVVNVVLWNELDLDVGSLNCKSLDCPLHGRATWTRGVVGRVLDLDGASYRRRLLDHDLLDDLLDLNRLRYDLFDLDDLLDLDRLRDDAIDLLGHDLLDRDFLDLGLPDNLLDRDFLDHGRLDRDFLGDDLSLATGREGRHSRLFQLRRRRHRASMCLREISRRIGPSLVPN